MTLQELRYVVALADIGHFARAAEACHIGQSTLSTQLRKLEDLLGVTLFDRSLRRATPTPIGEEIVARARVIVQEVGRIRDIARQGDDPMTCTLQLGAIPTVGPYLLPRVLPMIQRAFPGLRLLLRESMTIPLIEQLHSGRIDVALLALPIDGDGLRIETLFREPFVAALPASSPVVTKKCVTPEDFDGQPLLLLEEGHCLREQALTVCGRGMQKSEEIKATSLEMLRQMVALGIGSTLLPLLAVDGRIAKGRSDRRIEIRTFRRPVPTRTIGMVWRNRYPRHATLTRLVAQLRDCLPPGVTPLTR